MLIKSLKKKIVSELKNNQNVISISFVGSTNYSKEFNDIDVVVITNELDKKIFRNLNDSIKKINLLKFNENRKLKVFNKFGPLKFDKKKYLVIHLMVYSKKDHIDHVLQSPFTCYDWQRYKASYGKDLKKIFPVIFLNYTDFLNSRRSINSYTKDLNLNNLSIREYEFNDNKYSLTKIKINKKQKSHYEHHIKKFLLSNWIKFLTKKNIIFDNKKLLQFSKKELNFMKNVKSLDDFEINNFLKLFYREIIKFKKDNKISIFMRHAQLNKKYSNLFIGKKSDPSPSKKSLTNISLNDSLIITSPKKRALKTFNLKNQNNLISNLIDEIDYGKFEKLDYQKNKRLITDYFHNNVKRKFPLGEGYDDVLIRIIKFFNFVSKTNTSKNHIIITHNVTLRVVIKYLLNLKYTNLHYLKIKYLEKFKFIIYKGRYLPFLTKIQYYKLHKL